MIAHAYLAPPNFKMAEIPPKPENYWKIVCRSRQAVTFYSEILYNSLTKSLEENEQRTEEERRRYLQKFKEVFTFPILC